MITLFLKEFRAQKPFIFLILFLTTVPYLASGFGEAWSLRSIEKLYGDGLIHLGMEYSFITFFLSLGITYGLLVREIDDRTIEFLDSLPISRTQLFIAKWSAGLSVLALLPIVDSIVMIAIRALSRDSLDRSFHFDWIASSIFLQWVQAFNFFSIGLLLSFFRRFGWLLIGLIAWCFLIAGRFIPALQLKNLILFTGIEFVGQRFEIPWTRVLAYLIFGSLCSLVSYGLFLGGGRVLLGWLAGTESRIKQALLIVTSIVIAFVFLGVFSTYSWISMDDYDEASEGEVRVSFPSWATATRQTERYNVVYPTNLSSRVNELLDQADPTYQKVADFFEFQDATEIQVDMTSYSGHHLGTAYWNKLKMDLTAHDSVEELIRTLGHETTHVVLESLSQNQLKEHFGSTRFFHEGVATYIERRFFTDQPLVDQRLGAAILRSRKEVDFERLVDNDRLRLEHDSFLAYSLGEVFAAAVVSRFGEDALGKIARTFATKKNTEGLSGVALWRSVFQAAGFSLSEAIDEYYGLLDEAAEHHAEMVEQMPQVYPSLEKREKKLVLSFDQSPPKGWKVVVRFRSSSSAQDDEYWQKTVKNGSVSTPLAGFVGQSVAYQVGYMEPDKMPIFQPWETSRVP